MLAIRMQRTGRKGHAMFRVIVQDSRRTPTSGKVVAYLGSYDPHAKTVILDKDKASSYLKNGAQPSDRVALLLKNEGVKLPTWVNLPAKSKGEVRNPDKRRSTRPPEAEAPTKKPEAPAEAPAEAPKEDAKPVEEAPAEETPDAETTEKPEATEEVTTTETAEATEKPEAATDETAKPEEAAEADS
jgi:small subunit ribosomal protein S16